MSSTRSPACVQGIATSNSIFHHAFLWLLGLFLVHVVAQGGRVRHGVSGEGSREWNWGGLGRFQEFCCCLFEVVVNSSAGLPLFFNNLSLQPASAPPRFFFLGQLQCSQGLRAVKRMQETYPFQLRAQTPLPAGVTGSAWRPARSTRFWSVRKHGGQRPVSLHFCGCCPRACVGRTERATVALLCACALQPSCLGLVFFSSSARGTGGATCRGAVLGRGRESTVLSSVLVSNGESLREANDSLHKGASHAFLSSLGG